MNGNEWNETDQLHGGWNVTAFQIHLVQLLRLFNGISGHYIIYNIYWSRLRRNNLLISPIAINEIYTSNRTIFNYTDEGIV